VCGPGSVVTGSISEYSGSAGAIPCSSEGVAPFNSSSVAGTAGS